MITKWVQHMKEIFDELSNKKIDEILKTSDGIDFNNLICYFNCPNFTPINYIYFRNLMHIYDNIKKMVIYQQKKWKNIKNNLNQK